MNKKHNLSDKVKSLVGGGSASCTCLIVDRNGSRIQSERFNFTLECFNWCCIKEPGLSYMVNDIENDFFAEGLCSSGLTYDDDFTREDLIAQIYKDTSIDNE